MEISFDSNLSAIKKHPVWGVFYYADFKKHLHDKLLL